MPCFLRKERETWATPISNVTGICSGVSTDSYIGPEPSSPTHQPKPPGGRRPCRRAAQSSAVRSRPRPHTAPGRHGRPAGRRTGQGRAARQQRGWGPLLQPPGTHPVPPQPPRRRGRAGPASARICHSGRAPTAASRFGPSPAPGRSAAGRRARPAWARSPCCQRSGGAVPSRGSLPPRSVRVSSPRGEISRVLGRRSAPRSGSNCGPCVRQPSSRRVRGRRTGSSGDTRPDKPARSERRLTHGPL